MALALRCVQCQLGRHCEKGDIPATLCHGNHASAKHCVTSVGNLATGRLVIRDCLSVSIEYVCSSETIDFPGEPNITLQLCFTTCDGDGCNNKPVDDIGNVAAATVAPGLWLLFLAAVAAAAAAAGN
ncbi:PREDICTED: uncharacterized protein LOC106810347 isoform X2 [Priapulus caudatus]|uniref:Uncharacterized protein LOC106810347 isoform X2 n=1 Tax=Priapulus caudatus TaxID=37621 RepID=A0ABM1EAC7_PRICU|nr:PREDICTED: uncharacterized protein LOC106810347 isoform X2 [Priapulus caudatus]